MYTNGPYTPPGVDGHHADVSEHARRRQLERVLLRPDARSRVHQRDEHRPGREDGAGHARAAAVRPTWVRRSPWGGAVGRFWNPENKIPCSAPPFGELVALDVNRGEVAWKVPLGFVESLKAKGFDKTGTLNIGGSIATAGGVIFIGATIDCRFRAFESRTGKQLWETELPACAHTTPMTFLGKDGRQYVVVAAGGGSFLGAAPGSKILAFALPQAAHGGGRAAAGAEDAGKVGAAGEEALLAVRTRKRVLAWADVRNGITQHDSISHALATIERLGHESGRLRHLHPHRLAAHHQASADDRRDRAGEQFKSATCRYFDAIFFFGIASCARRAAARRSAVVRQGRRQGVRRRAFGGDRILLVAGVRRVARRPLRRAPVGHRQRHDRHRRSVVSGDAPLPARRSRSSTSSIRSRISRATRSACCAPRRGEDARRSRCCSARTAIFRWRGPRSTAKAACSIRSSVTRPKTGTTAMSPRCTSRPSSGRSV